ncbi:hypothetical protein BH11PLA2_BH11PLA2_33610 [soil metagenome]
MAADVPNANDETAPAPDEDLVAYLDGELDAEASQGVESELAHDVEARTKAEAYRKTYDLLDYLPKPEPSPTFASRTLTKIDPVPAAGILPPAVSTGATFNFNNASSHSVPMAVSTPAHRGWTLALWTLAALFAAGVGYFGHLLARPHLENRGSVQTSQQVRLLEHLPLYNGVDDLSFLQKLEEADLFVPHDIEYETSAVHAATLHSESVSSSELAKLEEVFRKLPPARQQQLRQLDEDFYALDSVQQLKFHGILERYAVWLDHLPEEYRKEVLAAPAMDERIEAIRRIRNRLWRKNLPASVKARLEETADKEEVDRILADQKNQEAARRLLWESARRQWGNLKSDKKPFPFDDADLTKQVEEYTATMLRPRMTPGELVRFEELRKDTAQGGYVAWYLYGAAILYAAESHAMLPEPKNGKPVMKIDDLPTDFMKRLRPAGVVRPGMVKRDLKDLPQHGKWPDFAEVVAQEAQQRNMPLPIPPFGPARLDEFKPEVEEAAKQLVAKLSPREKTDFEALQGKWPAYPKMLNELARRYDVVLPGVSLPGSPREWNKVYPIRGKK